MLIFIDSIPPHNIFSMKLWLFLLDSTESTTIKLITEFTIKEMKDGYVWEACVNLRNTKIGTDSWLKEGHLGNNGWEEEVVPGT